MDLSEVVERADVWSDNDGAAALSIKVSRAGSCIVTAEANVLGSGSTLEEESSGSGLVRFEGAELGI